MPNNRRGSSSTLNVPSSREHPRPKTPTPHSNGWIGFDSVSKPPSSTQVLPSTEIPIRHNLSSTLSRVPSHDLISSANVITPYQLSVKNQVPTLNPCPRSRLNVIQTHSCLKRKATDCNVNITNNLVRNLSCDLCQVSCSSALTLQQHVEGRTHQAKLKWMQLNKNGKEQNQHSQPRCDVCKIFCPDRTALDMHLKGKKHKAKLHELELGQKNGGENGAMILWCELCHVPCMNEDCFKSHLKGKKHIARVYNVKKKLKIET
ncbi:zinc finger RNA-binding -like [Olea europaea subsp. europaea]|nr:zinc finger RNA-binding -like [Olea europaea subsp. europaea]